MPPEDAPTGWSFEVDETSAGAFRLRAEDLIGRTLEFSGTDPTALEAEAKRQIEGLDLP